MNMRSAPGIARQHGSSAGRLRRAAPPIRLPPTICATMSRDAVRRQGTEPDDPPPQRIEEEQRGATWWNGPRRSGGERGIRTPETVSRLHAFQACAFNHSATSPGAADVSIRPRLRKRSGSGPGRCCARLADLPMGPMLRFISRFVGYWLLAAALVAAV